MIVFVTINVRGILSIREIRVMGKMV